jgi:hypothetical protein
VSETVASEIVASMPGPASAPHVVGAVTVHVLAQLAVAQAARFAVSIAHAEPASGPHASTQHESPRSQPQ